RAGCPRRHRRPRAARALARGLRSAGRSRRSRRPRSPSGRGRRYRASDGGDRPARGDDRMTELLLAVDGDSFAHRGAQARPKSIRSADGRPAGALVGFTSMLVGLWAAEQPSAVLVAWDALEVPTCRHEAFAGYQAGREFDDALLEQLAILPDLV